MKTYTTDNYKDFCKKGLELHDNTNIKVYNVSTLQFRASEEEYYSYFIIFYTEKEVESENT